MKNYYFLVFFVLYVTPINPPLWPEQFCQAMTVNFGDLTTIGKFWYDSTLDAQKFQFSNGNSKSGCGAVHPMNTPCNYLTANKMIYMIYPQKQLCCKIGTSDIYPRNWLQEYSYGDSFHVWGRFEDQDYVSQYYTDKSQLNIPRRQVEAGRVFLDYWTSSYSQKKFDKSVLDVPSYCQKFCYDHIQDSQQLGKFYENVKRFGYNFRIPQIKQNSVQNELRNQ